MAKWSELVKGRERLPLGGGAAYQARVDEAKAEFVVKEGKKRRAMGSIELATKYRALRDERDALELVCSALDCRIKAAEQLIVETFEASELESLKLADGSSIRTEPEPYASVENVELVRAWARERGLDSKMSLPWQTLNAEVKSLMMEGQADPPGVKVYFRTKVVLSR